MEEHADVLWQRKVSLKRDSNRLAAGLILYFILMVVCTVAEAAVKMISLMIKHHGNISEKMVTAFTNQMAESGLGYLIAVTLGLWFLSLFYRKLSRDPLFQREKSMTGKSFLCLLCVFMSVQMIFTIAAYALEHLFNLTGFSLVAEIDAASAGSQTITMFLYASILGPISEELIFRGFLLKTLKKYGKVLAIMVSAVLFGAFHGNFVQSIFAVFIGIILGYVAMEYSLLWAIVLHILNNCIFGDLLTYAVSGLSASLQNSIMIGLNAFFFMIAIGVLWWKRAAMQEYIRQNKTIGYKTIFTSAGVIIFFVMMFIEAILGIQKL